MSSVKKKVSLGKVKLRKRQRDRCCSHHHFNRMKQLTVFLLPPDRDEVLSQGYNSTVYRQYSFLHQSGNRQRHCSFFSKETTFSSSGRFSETILTKKISWLGLGFKIRYIIHIIYYNVHKNQSTRQ